MRHYLNLLVILALILPSASFAQLVKIIHTNDLHSQLEHAGDRSRGGYAAVKAVIDRLRTEAQAQGLETLVLDAGDLSEGNAFYLASEGIEVWKLMDSMGYDAITLGNHDYQAGTRGLDRTFAAMKPVTPFLAANFYVHPDMHFISKYLKPYAEFTRGGLKIAVVGVTTDDPVFKWLNDEGTLTNPVTELKNRVTELSGRVDNIIALTHIGIKKDKELVKAVSGLSLVVGGHSHTELAEATIIKDPLGQSIPIVQTGEHGQFVGDLLVDLRPGEPAKVMEYHLVPVYSDGQKDAAIESKVRDVRETLEVQYGRAWLHETVGTTEVPLLPQKRTPTVWSRFAADAIRKSARAELTLDVGEFSGIRQPAGPITREQLFNLYPRIFDFEKRYGWTVWTAEIRGWVMSIILKQALKLDYAFTTSGLTYKISTNKKGKPVVTNLRVNGRKINPFRNYRVALPEGIILGARGISPYTRYLFKRQWDTGVPIMMALESHLQDIGGVISADYPGTSARQGMLVAHDGGRIDTETVEALSDEEFVAFITALGEHKLAPFIGKSY